MTRSWSLFLLAVVLLDASLFTAAINAQGMPHDALVSSQQTEQPAEAPASTKKKKKSKKKKDAAAKQDGKAKPAKHPSFTIGKHVTIDVTGRIEGEVRGPTPAMGLDGPEGEWQDRRLGIQGSAFKRFDFEVSREFGQDFETVSDLSEKTAWRDVYVDTRVTKAFRVQAGQFKLPFGHEELIGETNLDFVNRSLAARVLSPGRDPGVMAHGRLFSKILEYQVGFFTRDGANARTSQTEGGQNARAARLVVSPFAASAHTALAPLDVGVAVMSSRLDDRLGIRGRTVLGDGVFFDRVDVNGQRDRFGLEAAWALGPVGLSSEYMRASDQRLGMGFSGEDLPSVDSSAWYLAGTWALTGERKHGRLEPRRDFLRGGVGAVEIAARVETLGFQETSFPTTDFGYPDLSKLAANADHVTTVGINWYLNHYAKVQLNVIREAVDDPERSPAPTEGGHFASTVIGMQFRF